MRQPKPPRRECRRTIEELERAREMVRRWVADYGDPNDENTDDEDSTATRVRVRVA